MSSPESHPTDNTAGVMLNSTRGILDDIGSILDKFDNDLDFLRDMHDPPADKLRAFDKKLDSFYNRLETFTDRFHTFEDAFEDLQEQSDSSSEHPDVFLKKLNAFDNKLNLFHDRLDTFQDDLDSFQHQFEVPQVKASSSLSQPVHPPHIIPDSNRTGWRPGHPIPDYASWRAPPPTRYRHEWLLSACSKIPSWALVLTVAYVLAKWMGASSWYAGLFWGYLASKVRSEYHESLEPMDIRFYGILIRHWPTEPPPPDPYHEFLRTKSP